MSQSIHPNPEYVLERMYQQVRKDHAHCTFHPTVGGRPDKYEQYEQSASGQYRFIAASSSLTKMEKTQAVERWFIGEQKVTFGGFEDNGNRLNRYWVKYTYPMTYRPKDDMNWVILPPRLSKPGFYTNMAQIDCVTAYYNVIKLVGLYPCVQWGNSFGVARKLEGYPFVDNKTVRNSLYGMVFNPRLTYITRAKGTIVIPEIPVQNPHLMQIVQCVFHSIAREAYKRGAVQWHTDGGILPADQAWPFMLWIASNYGLSVRLKCIGTAEVYRPDQYITPAHKPRKKINKPMRVNTIDGFKSDYLLGPYEDWLRGNLKHWVKRRAEPELIDEWS